MPVSMIGGGTGRPGGAIAPTLHTVLMLGQNSLSENKLGEVVT